MYNKIPVYIAEINYDDEGIECVSFVEQPATEVNLMTFSKDANKKMSYSIVDQEKHRIIAPIMRCDFPIYRRNGDFEYYVVYNKDTIEKMARKMLIDNTQNNFNCEHKEAEKIEGVYLYQLFIKDADKGISPNGFEDVENGSLFGVYEIFNDELWNKIEHSESIGLSLEGYFDLKETDIEIEEEVDDKEIDELFELVEKLEKQLNK